MKNDSTLDKPIPRSDSRDELLTGREREQEYSRADGPGPLGVHPAGTVVGGVAGAVAAGAAVGAVAGPVGAAVGAAIGAAAGGMAGKLAVDLVDPQMEDEFWRKNWSDRTYIDGGFTYDQDWRGAYLYGVDMFRRHPEREFDEIEPELSSGWNNARGESRLEWSNARHASKDAWTRASELARSGAGVRN